MKPWLVIDLDGTLLNVANRHYSLYCMILSRWGIHPKSFADYWAARRSGNANLKLMVESGLPKEGISQAVRIWKMYIESRQFLSRDSLWPGVVEWLRKRACEYCLFLCTVRSRVQYLKWQLESLGIMPYFSVVECVGHGPNQGARKAQRVVKKDVRPLVWIGDTEDDVLAARALGIPAVVVDYGQRDPELLDPLKPDLVISSLWDVDLRALTKASDEQ